MECVPPGQDDTVMDVVTVVGAVVAGLLTVIVGVFSLASIWFDDLF